MDDFEQFLKSQPLRAVPPQWRGRILAEVRKGEARKEKTPMAGWRGWLWPSPYAWGALAAAWLVIFALNAAAQPKRAQTMAQMPSASDRAMVAFWQERRRELEAFLLPETAVVSTPLPPAPPAKPDAHQEQFGANKSFHV